MPQLDIFADNRDVGLRNDLAQALLDGDVPAAERAAQSLRAGFGEDAALTPAAVLIEHLRAQPPASPAPSRLGAQAVLDARRHLEGPVTAAATAPFWPARWRPPAHRRGRRQAKPSRPWPPCCGSSARGGTTRSSCSARA